MPEPRTIKTGKFSRSFNVEKSAVNEAARTVELSFSSESPCERWFGIEILDHGKGSADLSRLNSGGALLLDHNTEKQIGVIETAEIASDKKGRATVRFGKSALAEEIFQDVKDGIRKLVSVGYTIEKMVTDKVEKGVETLRATAWTPLEISIVSIPVDTGVGVGRSDTTKEFTTVIMKNLLLDPAVAETAGTPKTEPNLEVIKSDTRKAESLRIREIQATATQFRGRVDKLDELAAEAVEKGHDIQDFRKVVLEKMVNAKPLPTAQPELLRTMEQSEKRKYSLTRALVRAADENLDGFELEVSQELSKLMGHAPSARGFHMPASLLLGRALTAGSATGGGYLIGTELKTGEMIELLRNKALVETLGARRLEGLVGNIAIPKVNGGATAYWLPEGGTVTESDQSFGQLALLPKALLVDTAYNKQLLNQTNESVEAFVRDDMAKVTNLALDLAALNGLGKNGEPLGVFNTPGRSTDVHFGAAATLAKLISFETNVATNNADSGSMSYLTTPAARGKLKGIPKVTAQAIYLWENDITGGGGVGMINGYRAYATNQVPSDKMIFGNWADMLLARWAGIDVVVDPYSGKKQNLIEITMTQWADIGIRHAKSFCVSDDSAAQ